MHAFVLVLKHVLLYMCKSWTLVLQSVLLYMFTCVYLSAMIRCYNQLCCKCLHLSLIIKSAVHVDIFMLISALMFLCTGLLYMCIDAIIGHAVNVYI